MKAEEQLKNLGHRLNGAGISYTTRQLDYNIYCDPNVAHVDFGQRGDKTLSLMAPETISPDLTSISLIGAHIILEGYKGSPIHDNAGFYIDFSFRSMHLQLKNLSDRNQRREISQRVSNISKSMEYKLSEDTQ